MSDSKLLKQKSHRLASEAKHVFAARDKTWAVLPLPTRRAVIYNRVAALEGSENHLATYLNVCRQYAQAQGFEIVGEFADVGSALQLDRTGLNAVRQMVARGSADTSIIYEFHCLTRSVGHALTLLDEFASHGARLYSAYRQMEITV